jgi:hypothetical protein
MERQDSHNAVHDLAKSTNFSFAAIQTVVSSVSSRHRKVFDSNNDTGVRCSQQLLLHVKIHERKRERMTLVNSNAKQKNLAHVLTGLCEPA